MIAYYEADGRARDAQLSELRRSATEGDLISQYLLGCLCSRSDMACWEEAARWFEAAAQQALQQEPKEADRFGNGAAAQYCLADAYEKGRGVAVNEALAVHWLEHAAAGGVDLAQFQLGMRYKSGQGVDVDDVKAHRLLRAAAIQDYREARWALDSYPDFEGAAAGNVEAQFELAEMYSAGRGVEKDLTLAAQWHAAAIKQGHVWALFRLADALISNPSAPGAEYKSLVIERLKAYAENGNGAAQYRVAKSLLTGVFGVVDVEQAYQRLLSVKKIIDLSIDGELLLRKLSIWPAAKAGDPRAGYELAWLFESLKNYEYAVLWYRKVIDQLQHAPAASASMFENGSAAQCNLADKYEHGLGVPQDYQSARYWYGQSAAQNNCVAQFSLGNMHLHGLGVPKDVETAKQWFRKSAAQGYEDAQKALDALPGA